MKQLYLFFMLFICAGTLMAQQADVAPVLKLNSSYSVKSAKAFSVNNGQVLSSLITADNVLFDNGPLVNSPGTGAGGADESVVQGSLGLNHFGLGFQTNQPWSLADDFTLDQTSNITDIVVYGYQTGSTTEPTINEVQLRIYDGKPGDGGAVIWGDETTNRLTNIEWSGIYRVLETTSGNTMRPIMKCMCTIDESLPSGTYWLEIEMGGTLGSGPWCPIVSVNGQAVTGDGMQFNGSNWVIWSPYDDNAPTAGIPFQLLGTTDTIPPVVKCRDYKVDLKRSGEYTLSDEEIAYISAGTSDNETAAENLVIEFSPRTITCDMAGESVVTITATDEAGNVGTCQSTFTVTNPYPVQLVGGEDVEVVLPEGKCETTVEYPYVFAIGPCVNVTQIEGLGREGVFPVGTTTEVWVGTNTSGRSDTVSFSVTVLSPVMAPTIDAIANVSTDEDMPVLASLAGISNGGSCDMSDVSLQVAFDTDYLESIEIEHLAGDSTGTLNIVPVENRFGESEVIVTLEDGEGMKTIDTFKVTINSVNDAPFLVSKISDQELDIDETLSVSLSKLLGVVFDDIDDTELTYSARFENGTSPDWINVNEEADVLNIDFSPVKADTGCYNIIVEAMDAAGAVAADTFELCVKDVLVGIEDLSKAGFEVNMYPNPTKGLVVIEPNTILSKEVEIAVTNIAGSEVFRKTYRSGEALQFNMSEQVSGMYMVLVQSADKRVVKKLILDRK